MTHDFPFTTVLIANRGEIAVRIARSVQRMGLRAAAVYAPQDADALHVRVADVAVRLPGTRGSTDRRATAATTYLDIGEILRACRETGAEAVHPGYGFLSENVEFARALEEEGIAFIGPPSSAINLMGDKIRSKNHVAGHGVPVVPGVSDPGLDDAALIEAADRVGFPLLIKPSAGGGGKGMFAVRSAEELPAALASARRTAAGAFGDDTLLLERLVTRPRHIEVQVLADGHGRTVHLGERECSLQRRHQKVVEEAPAPLLAGLGADGERIRAELGAAAVRAAESVGYIGAGTVEFLVSDDAPGEFFFMEMNTRLQVEHPVTEEVVRIAGGGGGAGGEERPIDLVEWQVRIAAGERLPFVQDDVVLRGHAIEARIYAEDPAEGFLPSSGEAFRVELPGGDGVRVDSAIEGSGTVGSEFDPLIAKVIAHGPTRDEALERLQRALAATTIVGVRTNVAFLRALLAHPEVAAGRLDTNLIGRWTEEQGGRFVPERPTRQDLVFAVRGQQAWEREFQPAAGSTGGPIGGPGQGPWQLLDGWRLGEPARPTYWLDVDGETVEVVPEANDSDDAGDPVTAADRGDAVDPDGGRVLDSFGDFAATDPVSGARVLRDPAGGMWLVRAGTTNRLRLLDRREVLHRQLAVLEREEAGGEPNVTAPMPGAVVALDVESGAHVAAGDRIGAVEAMKMEHPLHAWISGTVTLHVRLGEQVGKDQVIAVVHADPRPDAGSDSTPPGSNES
ncbi:biotin carboxylase N-terminal domain-containing protein [Zhihengliuella sp.]|uniref:acetyl/propionyl/methylcrotonyl-CoA carboxylase subunit alpha n=1 Tax=Zhihengliuella sp. TaxID=1954483 RepID=UPI002810EB54|nr:biotin carboxylase N-terminal domain-containing protein [Zhihengliuella sp.]